MSVFHVLLYFFIITINAHTQAHKERLTAFIVDDTLLFLLGVELAERAVLRVLFDISLSGPHPHPTGHTAGRPADPL